MKIAIDVQGMTKIYQPGRKGRLLTAVDGITFEVHKGEVFGSDPDQEKIGVVPEASNLYDELSARSYSCWPCTPWRGALSTEGHYVVRTD